MSKTFIDKTLTGKTSTGKTLLAKSSFGTTMVAGLAFVALASIASPASAQVVFGPRSLPFNPFTSPYDESYDTQPSYQITPAPDGYPSTVKVIRRCAFIGGWNVGDFDRSVNGIPLGVDHTCPSDEASPSLRSRY